VLVGGPGKDDLQGQAGDDLLVGNDGKDKLKGGAGKNVLIGGSGKDDLKAGDEEDLLIGGFTAYDDYVDGLGLIMKEWTSDRPYEQRLDNLRKGNGLLAEVSGVKLKATAGKSRSVFDDAQRDKLRGDRGRDWFFADLDQLDKDDDDVKDLEVEEVLDQILEP
jgi:Ca2+-binding RTX toxin-like protein